MLLCEIMDANIKPRQPISALKVKRTHGRSPSLANRGEKVDQRRPPAYPTGRWIIRVGEMESSVVRLEQGPVLSEEHIPDPALHHELITNRLARKERQPRPVDRREDVGLELLE